MANAWTTAAALFLLLAALLARAEAGPLAQAETPPGPDASTLLVCDGPALPYSLLDLRGVVARLLTRANTRVVTKMASELAPGDLLAADYIVWLGTGTQPAAGNLGDTPPAKPLLVCGMPPREAAKWPGADAFGKFPPAAESWAAATIRLGPATLESPVGCVFPAMGSPGDAPVLARIQAGGRNAPLAWRSRNVLWFPCLPLEDATGAALSAALPDFFDTSPGASGVLLALDDFHPGCDPAALRRAADYLSAKGRPFAVTVRMPDENADAAKAQEFVSALAYAQARRGRIFLMPRAGQLWDAKRDRPPNASDMDAAAAGAKSDFARGLANGVLPLGVRLPDSGASLASVDKLAQSFGLGIGTVLPSDATATATFVPSTITRAGGMLLLPGGTPLQDGAGPGEEFAKNLLLLSGTILAVQVPAWLPFDRIAPLLARAAALGDTFLDPADAAAWASSPDGALWTSAAPAPAPAFAGKALLRAYDVNAQLLFERKTSTDLPVPPAPNARFFVLTPCAP